MARRRNGSEGEDANPGRGSGAPPAGFRRRPENVEAEQALLGAILVNNDAYQRVASFLQPEHFYEPVHGRIYAAMQRTIGSGHVADPITLKREFDEDETLKELDGWQYLARLAASAETIFNAQDYGRVIFDLAIKRALIEAGEQVTNAAYDPSITDTGTELLDKLKESVEQISGTAVKGRLAEPVCRLATIDYTRIAEDQIEGDRWLIAEWLPVGTAGVLAGPGAAGKSFLELIKLICLATGTPFLGYEVEPTPVVGYFAEDDQQRLERRVQKICRALGIDPRDLIGRCDIISLRGHNRKLFRAERMSYEVEATAWFEEVVGRCHAIGARYASFDHVGRLTAINRNEPSQVFDMWGRLDAMAHAIDGCVCMLAHPSKTDLRAGKGPRVGGAVAMIDAPRWVHVLDWHKPKEEDDEGDFRIFTNDKPNYTRRFALRLEEGPHGLVENKGEVDPDHPAGKPAGRPKRWDRTVALLRELYEASGRPVSLEELVDKAIERRIVHPAKDQKARGNREGTIRGHLEQSREVDDRGNNHFAIRP